MSFTTDFKARVGAIATTRWIRFAVVSLVFLAWVVWMQTWWLALFEILLFDIYITGYIPFTWWKKSPSAVTRTVMSWVDAIVYALVLVYFVFAFVGQNYQIPSSSLEKTLLTGDYLWVNKMVYGPRADDAGALSACAQQHFRDEVVSRQSVDQIPPPQRLALG